MIQLCTREWNGTDLGHGPLEIGGLLVAIRLQRGLRKDEYTPETPTSSRNALRTLKMHECNTKTPKDTTDSIKMRKNTTDSIKTPKNTTDSIKTHKNTTDS